MFLLFLVFLAIIVWPAGVLIFGLKRIENNPKTIKDTTIFFIVVVMMIVELLLISVLMNNTCIK